MADLGICLSVFTRRAASLESDLNFGPSVAVCIPCALKIECNYPCFLEKKTEGQRGHSAVTELISESEVETGGPLIPVCS